MNIPVYLVSLEQDTDRRIKLKERFPKSYNDFIDVKAVDGRKLSAKEYYDKTIDYYLSNHKLMSPSELGCTLSHIKALKSFLETKSEYALILEDDVIGDDKSIDKVLESINYISQDALLLCGGQEGLNKKYHLGKTTKYSDIYEVNKFSHKFIFRTCCYVVTRKSAEKILEYHSKGVSLADDWSVFFKSTNIKIYYKSIFKHPVDLGGSHIEEDRKKLNKSLLEKLFSITVFNKIFLKIVYFINYVFLRLTGWKSLR